MSYEAAIASAGRNDVALAKSFIIALDGATSNWYSKLPPEIYLLMGEFERQIPF